ncbi:MAG: hypothetical protein Q9204_003053 [Flavoplaca sp. TL-2023a]
MVLLSATPAMIEAVKLLLVSEEAVIGEPDWDDLGSGLSDLALGGPITHTQAIAVSKLFKKIPGSAQKSSVSNHLDDLLRGSKLYYEPFKPKHEPTSEYKTLMARLRREEEARAYERMTTSPLPLETFEQHFPDRSKPKLFSGSQDQSNTDDDDITYADVNRQMAMILNVLLSIVACSIALWLVANRWSAPRRLALSMGGSILVAVAESVVYAGYLRRVKEARDKGKKQVEIKEIVKTWVISGDEKVSAAANIASTPSAWSDVQLRQRKTKPS